MLIPLGTDRPLRRTTTVTYALMGVNAAAFAVQEYLRLAAPEKADALFVWGAIWRSQFMWWQPLTSCFLHGGYQHLFFNMLFLWVFGPNLEDRLGRIWFLLFYLCGGAFAMGLHAVFSAHPAIGASGAISAVTGAYLVMFPRTRIRTFFLLTLALLWVPAWWFIGLAIVWDFAAPAFGHDDGIAHLAHIGGTIFGSGVAFGLLAFKLIPGEPYDLFFQTKQALRRRQIREAQSEFTRRMENQLAAGKPSSEEASAQVKARADVTRLVVAGDFKGASAEYRRLADTFGHMQRGAVLSRGHQYDLAAWLYQQQDYSASAYAFERFLDAYPTDGEAAAIKLLLGRINARHLNDPVRAKALLSEALVGLRDEGAKGLAKQELESLG